MHIRADTGEKIVDSWQFLSEGEEFDGVWSFGGIPSFVIA